MKRDTPHAPNHTTLLLALCFLHCFTPPFHTTNTKHMHTLTLMNAAGNCRCRLLRRGIGLALRCFFHCHHYPLPLPSIPTPPLRHPHPHPPTWAQLYIYIYIYFWGGKLNFSIFLFKAEATKVENDFEDRRRNWPELKKTTSRLSFDLMWKYHIAKLTTLKGIKLKKRPLRCYKNLSQT